jgi:hypothetical protein
LAACLGLSSRHEGPFHRPNLAYRTRSAHFLSVRLIGNRVLTAAPGPAEGLLLRVRAFSIVGGVKVRAA